jgi:hypothetical protein
MWGARPPQPGNPTEIVPEPSEGSHGAVQGALASLGRLYGYDTYVPRNDRSCRHFNGVALGEYTTLNDIEMMVPNEAARRRIEQIDVLWTVEDTDGALWPRYAFEVEHTTRVRSGLERLRNLPARFQTRLYIIAPTDSERALFERCVREPGYSQLASTLAFYDYAAIKRLYTLAVEHDRLRGTMGFEYCNYPGMPR